MNDEPAVAVDSLVYRYGDRQALRGVGFQVARGEIFGLLGPNGGGKTTLFRLLSTARPPTSGQARIFGEDVVAERASVRRGIGVVFQSPSLDRKLSAYENLRHHGHLYGLSGRPLREAIAQMLGRVGLADRVHDRVERLSGGQQRRVEIAKGLLHQPRLLLMDEPSTGLDPGARRDLWRYLEEVRQRDGLTVLLTTHLMDEAGQCDRVGILHQGEMVALGAPATLCESIGGEVLSLETRSPDRLAEAVRAQLGLEPRVVGNTIRLERQRGHELVAQLFESFPGQIDAVTVRRPSLEDVFIHRTGHQFWEEEKPGREECGPGPTEGSGVQDRDVWQDRSLIPASGRGYWYLHKFRRDDSE